MSDGINENIIKGIRESCGGDDVMAEFLIDLIYEEAEHPGQWWWRETYNKKIKKY